MAHDTHAHAHTETDTKAAASMPIENKVRMIRLSRNRAARRA